jgi:fermentation-respiration switch protein FrsA (DUF1100 family)
MVVGESLGSGVAVQVAKSLSEDEGLGGTPARLVLLTPFASMRTVAARNMPLLPAKFLVLDRYDSAQHMLQVRGPIAILVARQDELVSAEEGRELAKAAAMRERAGDRVELLEVDARHSTWQGVLSSADWDQLLGRQKQA